MIPDFKTYLRESTWGGMLDRGTGDTVKKEDDIDFLDRIGLVQYLKDNYTYRDNSSIFQTTADDGSIYINLYEDNVGYNVYLIYRNIEGDSELCISGGIESSAPEIYDDLKYRYTTHTISGQDLDGHEIVELKVEPKGCRYINITNKFFIEILDFIIERVRKPLTREIEKK